MKVKNDTSWKAAWVVSKLRPTLLECTFIIKGTFDLKLGAKAVPAEEGAPPTGETPYPEAPAQSLFYDSDFAPLKVMADLLLIGDCHAPGGQPVTTALVEFAVGSWKKALVVFGDRTWQSGFFGRDLPEPLPFTTMPIRYERAYGGKKSKKNPLGIGADGVRLPNIEDPSNLIHSPRDSQDPAGFGPLSPLWPQRAGARPKLGKAYLKERWPWYPEDFDWGCFNAAPHDQQIELKLLGDEKLRMVNLHREHPVFESQLPGLRPQVFVRYQNGADLSDFQEAPLKLDTVWVDMAACKLVLVWRGRAPVSHLKLQDVAEVHVAEKKLSEPAFSPAVYAGELKRAEAAQVQEAAEAAEKERAEDAALEKAAAEAQAEADAHFERARAQAEQAKAALQAMGLDPGLVLMPLPPPSHSAMLAEIRTMLSEIPKAAGSMQQAVADFEANAPPASDSTEPWTRERFLHHLQEGKSFAEEDLTGLDLSGIDAAGADLSGIVLTKANLSSANLCKANFMGANLSEAKLSGADLAGANLAEADLSGANLEYAILREANLDRATVCDATLTQAILDGTAGRITDFSGSNLTGAHFVGSRLVQPDFSECRLERAVFRQAVIPNARFGKCQAAGIIMEAAEMHGMRAGDEPDFTGGNFQRLKADRSIWIGAKLNGARFQYASLLRADFSGACLRGAQMGAAHLSGATFEDGSLEEASLLLANVFQGSFERTNLERCDLRGANCYEAEFWEAKLDNALLEGANLSMTKLEKP